jgi:hypothetical protein
MPLVWLVTFKKWDTNLQIGICKLPIKIKITKEGIWDTKEGICDTKSSWYEFYGNSIQFNWDVQFNAGHPIWLTYLFQQQQQEQQSKKQKHFMRPRV